MTKQWTPTILIVCLIMIVALSSVPGVSSSNDVFRYVFKDKVAMDMDEEVVAIRATKAGVTSINQRYGSRYDIAPYPHKNWNLVKLAQSSTSVGISGLINELYNDSAVEFISPVFRDRFDNLSFLTEVILLQFDESVDDQSARVIIFDKLRLKGSLKSWPSLSNAYLLHCDEKNGLEVLNYANSLSELDEVIFAEVDRLIQIEHFIDYPNDGGFYNLWGIHRTCAPVYPNTDWECEGQITDWDMSGLQAWSVTTGNPNILVMILDDGIQQDHPDLNQIPGRDFTGQGGGGGHVGVYDHHGTLVAGCVSAKINNGFGSVGIAPDCRVVSARVGEVIDSDGRLNIQASWVVDALEWGRQIGVRVTNASLGGPSLDSAALSAKYLDTYNLGMVHFAATGNHGMEVAVYPAAFQNVAAVGALRKSDYQRASFSNYFYTMDFCAPGENIYTTNRLGYYEFTDGTSFASPYAAGVAALLLSVKPSLSSSQVITIMRDTAKDRDTTGVDKYTGYGAVDACNALSSLGDFNLSGPETMNPMISSSYQFAATFQLHGGPSFNVTNTIDWKGPSFNGLFDSSEPGVFKFSSDIDFPINESINVTSRYGSKVDEKDVLITSDYLTTEYYLDISSFDVASSILPLSNNQFVFGGSTREIDAKGDMFYGNLYISGAIPWSFYLGLPDYYDGFGDLCRTSDGGFALCGSTMDQWGNRDALIVKLDSQGQLEWLRYFGGSGSEQAFDIVQAMDGGYTIVGSSDSYGGGSSEVYLVHTDSNGNLVFQKTFNDSASYSSANSLNLCKDGGYIISATRSEPSRGDSEFWFIKTDASGNLMWDHRGGVGFITSIAHREDPDLGNERGIDAFENEAGGFDLFIQTTHIELTSKCSGCPPTIPVARASLYFTSTLENPANNPSDYFLYYKDPVRGIFRYANAVIPSIGGGYLIAGAEENSGSTSYSTEDVFLTKENPSEEPVTQWKINLGADRDDGANSVAQLDDGTIAMAGYTNSFPLGGTDTDQDMYFIFIQPVGDKLALLVESVWGLDANGLIYTRSGVGGGNGKGTSWVLMPGRLDQITVGQSSVWGLVDGLIFFRGSAENDGAPFEYVPGGLRHLASGPTGHVWGISNDNLIFARTGVSSTNLKGSNWQYVPGGLNQLAVGPDSVWGLTAGGQIFCRPSASPGVAANWEYVPGGLAQIAVGASGDVWGLASDGLIYYRTGVTAGNPKGTDWQLFPGRLAQIAVGGNSLWGLVDWGGIFYRASAAPDGVAWEYVPGGLVQISVGGGASGGGAVIDLAEQLVPRELRLKSPSSVGDWIMY